MGSNPSAFPQDLTRPVERVSWPDATNYCAILTSIERAAGRVPAGWAYRLPTEAEWEYACRAGTTTRFSFGDDLTYALLGSYAWYYSNSGGTTHQVATRLANPWGLYDMQGNVWNWCKDYAGAYPGGAVTNYTGPATGSARVCRGGSWNNISQWCRAAFRDNEPPTPGSNQQGLRVVLAPAQP
jgi:formylglycine-generating enzyme required for sulfatase activity